MAQFESRIGEDVKAAFPPVRPLLIYDGDCGFCRAWIRRWQQTTGDAVDYAPSQEAGLRERFPEIPTESYSRSVQFVEPDGFITRGARAVLKVLAYNRRYRFPLWAYEHVPGLAPVAESLYALVARNRMLFSRLSMVLYGRHVERPSYLITRKVFLTALGFIYLCAFVSLGVQMDALIGQHGILPAKDFFDELRGAGVDHIVWRVPSLCWFSTQDWFLHLLCWGGAALSVLLMVGVAPALVCFLLWLFYLSLFYAGQVFLGFQWDLLLLETGLLAIFFAPLELLPRPLARQSPPSRVVLWLLRWLMFRFLFLSGLVKLTTDDPTLPDPQKTPWRDLTALNYHYFTQPLPTPLSWYAHNAPNWFGKLSLLVVFAVELGAVFLVFAPRRLRLLGAGAMIFLQVMILLTGNYGYFNLLTIVLCIPLIDDFRWPQGWRKRFLPEGTDSSPRARSLAWPRWILYPVALLIFLATSGAFLEEAGVNGGILAQPALLAHELVSPLVSTNGYGLFRVMTRERLEIVLEGSNDRQTWLAYDFKYKPGPLERAPHFNLPHQPRLDWQMWFAVLGPYQSSPWFFRFCSELLKGNKTVAGLLRTNPFPDTPPKYLRATLYRYTFTTPAQRRATGNWWSREKVGLFCPVLSAHQLEE